MAAAPIRRLFESRRVQSEIAGDDLRRGSMLPNNFHMSKTFQTHLKLNDRTVRVSTVVASARLRCKTELMTKQAFRNPYCVPWM
eukprot:508643-Pyramimonas_sp.AAC.1